MGRRPPVLQVRHNAIWIQDRAKRTDRVYNFGTSGSIHQAAAGVHPRPAHLLVVRLRHPADVACLRLGERTIEVQELDLDAAAKLGLKQRLDENALAQNRNYKYDYFLDNCSTRVRDAIDVATGGRLRTSAQGPARLTLRGQALRLTPTSPRVPGPLHRAWPIDRPRRRSLGRDVHPARAGARLRSVTVPAAGQGSRPLVKRNRPCSGKRAPPLEQPPERAVTLLLAGWPRRGVLRAGGSRRAADRARRFSA